MFKLWPDKNASLRDGSCQTAIYSFYEYLARNDKSYEYLEQFPQWYEAIIDGIEKYHKNTLVFR